MTIYLKWTIVGPGWCLSSFSAIWCFRTSQYFPPKSHLIVIFFFLLKFWLPLHSCSVLHEYCSIEAALVQYQILLKEVMLNWKFVFYSWLIIKKIHVGFCQFLSVFVMYLVKPVAYLAICRVFKAFSRVFSNFRRVFSKTLNKVKLCADL